MSFLAELMQRFKPKVTLHDLAFVLRCSGAATLSYLVATALDLVHPAWASISAVVVSQETLNDTRHAAHWRFAGTIVGIVVGVVASSLIAPFFDNTAVQMGVSVAICAALVRRWRNLKVAMWTAPILFFAHEPGSSLLMAGVWRGSEVVLGGLIGAALHWVVERVIGSGEREENAGEA